MYPIHFNELPNGYAALENEPEFDPAIHLALEKPETLYSLSDLGYTAKHWKVPLRSLPQLLFFACCQQKAQRRFIIR